MKRNNFALPVALIVGLVLLVLSQTIFRFSSPFPGLRQLPTGFSLYDLDKLLSPDGNWLLTRSTMSDVETKTKGDNLSFDIISTMNSENKLSVNIAAKAFWITEWSPDSSMLAILVNTVSGSNVCYKEKFILLRIVDGKRLEQDEFLIPPDSDCVTLMWSPDSSKILLLPYSNKQEMLFFDVHGKKVGSYLPSPLTSKMWWTERGLYYYVGDRQNPSQFLGELYLLNTENYSTQQIKKGIENPLIFSPKGDRLITLDDKKANNDVLQIWDTTSWKLEKTISLPGEVSEMPGGLRMISLVYDAPVISFTVESVGRRAFLLDWKTYEIWDCGEAATVVGWRSNIQSALAVRGLGAFEGQIGWFHIPIRLEPIPQSSCQKRD